MATLKILCALECTADTLRLLSVANTLLPMVGLIIQSMKEIVWNNPHAQIWKIGMELTDSILMPL